MPIHAYYCAECAQVQYKLSMPARGGCIMSPFHRWQNLGLKGNSAYKCTKCLKEVSTVKKPFSYGCSQGTFHEWVEKE